MKKTNKNEVGVYVLVGIVGSGKSSYCKKFLQDNPRSLWVNDDSIVKSVHFDVYQQYSHELKPLYKSIENIIISFASVFQYSVLVDRGINLTKKSRRRFIGLANSHDMPCFCIVMPVDQPEEHALRRCKSDDRGYPYELWLKVIRGHLAIYEQPDLDEGFTDIIYVNNES